MKTLGEVAMDGWIRGTEGTGIEKWESVADAVKAEVLRRHDAVVTKLGQEGMSVGMLADSAAERRYALLQAAATITAQINTPESRDGWNTIAVESVRIAGLLLAEIERRHL